jgi:hypothetical protein
MMPYCGVMASWICERWKRHEGLVGLLEYEESTDAFAVRKKILEACRQVGVDLVANPVRTIVTSDNAGTHVGCMMRMKSKCLTNFWLLSLRFLIGLHSPKKNSLYVTMVSILPVCCFSSITSIPVSGLIMLVKAKLDAERKRTRCFDSSVGVEATFSRAKALVNDKRASLSSNSLQAQLLLMMAPHFAAQHFLPDNGALMMKHSRFPAFQETPSGGVPTTIDERVVQQTVVVDE